MLLVKNFTVMVSKEKLEIKSSYFKISFEFKDNFPLTVCKTWEKLNKP